MAMAGETAAAQNPFGIIYAALFYGTLGLADCDGGYSWRMTMWRWRYNMDGVSICRYR